MPKKSETNAAGKFAAIWDGETARNGYKCRRCGKLLLHPSTQELTKAVVLTEKGERVIGACACGAPALVIDKDYSGEQKSENWEEQLRLEHAEEVAKLEEEIATLRRGRADYYRKNVELQQKCDARGIKITSLSDQIELMKKEIDKYKKKIQHNIAEINALTAEVKRLKEGRP